MIGGVLEADDWAADRVRRIGPKPGLVSPVFAGVPGRPPTAFAGAVNPPAGVTSPVSGAGSRTGPAPISFLAARDGSRPSFDSGA